ncbi:MAG: MerR family transcriptional regulator [Atopobiaceae bacterium]|nr:MerR family transcriptional regulator [Atopobiaceae bacterium]
MREEGLIKISEMAALHGISRQALILYDKNDLLKPVYIAENGYRYYSPDQIPRLRQICLLKAMGVPLASIASYLDGVSTNAMVKLLRQRTADIDAEMERLANQRSDIAQYVEIFDHVKTYEHNQDLPMVEWLPERKAIYAPYPSDDMDPKRLHLTLMDAWGSLLDAGMVPSLGFGSMLKVDALEGDRPLEGAGSIIFLPRDVPIEGAQVVTLQVFETALPDVGEVAVEQLVAGVDISVSRVDGAAHLLHAIEGILIDFTTIQTRQHGIGGKTTLHDGLEIDLIGHIRPPSRSFQDLP